jgi:hypothetical protein
MGDPLYYNVYYIGYKLDDWTKMTNGRHERWALVNTVMNLQVSYKTVSLSTSRMIASHMQHTVYILLATNLLGQLEGSYQRR